VAEARPPIVRGREYELRVLEEQLDAVRLGVGTVTLIEGRPASARAVCSRKLGGSRSVPRFELVQPGPNLAIASSSSHRSWTRCQPIMSLFSSLRY